VLFSSVFHGCVLQTLFGINLRVRLLKSVGWQVKKQKITCARLSINERKVWVCKKKR